MEEEMRNRIWDFLYRSDGPQQVAIIAEQLNEPIEEIEQVVNDPWFEAKDGLVAIAYRGG